MTGYQDAIQSKTKRNRFLCPCVDKLSTVETYVIVVRKPDYVLVYSLSVEAFDIITRAITSQNGLLN